MRALFLLDHDNIPFGDYPLRSIVNAWLPTAAGQTSGETTYIDVRAYGGWFDGTTASQARFAAADFYQRTCPSVLLQEGRLCRLSFAFADHLLLSRLVDSDGAPRITHTVAVRHAPLYMRRKTDPIPCPLDDCELPRVRKWLKKKRACTRTACPRTMEDAFERLEQKQVDVHLAVDLVGACLPTLHYDAVLLASDDWDLLPAILAAALQPARTTAIALARFKGTSTYLDSALKAAGITPVVVPRWSNSND